MKLRGERSTMWRGFLLFLLQAQFILAQSITGSIVGTVRDSSGLAVAGAEVTITDAATGISRFSATNDHGDFVFSSVAPGAYDVAVKAAGFKLAERKNLVLPASETRSVGDIGLEVGDTNQTVTVTAAGSTVQTASAERGDLISANQIDDIQIRGRNLPSFLALVPGVSVAPDTEIPNRSFATNLNGNRVNSLSITIDGMGQNQASASLGLMAVSQDAVAEVKVISTGYEAQYGRFSGGIVEVVTKSGARDFHGRASYFMRNEDLNANNFFNNTLGLPRPRYRYNGWNYGIGGPVFIPKKWNRDRQKLFFYWSQEGWPVSNAGPLRQVTTPTALERAGNFSQSLNPNGSLIIVKDPSSGAPFPGNIVPTTRLDPNGQALLKSFPLPNFSNQSITGGRYNFVEQNFDQTPYSYYTLKLDYNLNPRHQISASTVFARQSNVGFCATSCLNTNWDALNDSNIFNPSQQVIHYAAIYSPTLVNEVTLGMNGFRNTDSVGTTAQLAPNLRSTVGFDAGQFNPAINPLGILPQLTFGGVTGAANRAIDGRFPMHQTNIGYSVSDNITKTIGAHTLKAGVVGEKLLSTSYNDSANNFMGNFDFSTDANNPGDTGYAYANAALGNYRTYTETSARPFNTQYFTGWEWFVQDSWKASRRLTFDIGARMYWNGFLVTRSLEAAGFVPAQYNPANAVRLIRPAVVGGKTVGLDPVTGQIYPSTLAGAIVPGSGNPYDGMIEPAKNKGFPPSLINNPGVQAAPRFGFAWDPSGKGKTAIRGGFGVFYNRTGFAAGANTTTPPVETNPVLYYGTISSLLSGSGFIFPQRVSGVEANAKTPSVMNYHMSIQQSIGFGVVLDASYVGSLGRNLLWEKLLDSIPLGTDFLPSSANPVNPKTALSSIYLRSLPGYDGVTYSEWGSSSNYNALQMTAQRRFAHGFQLDVAWSWSKAMDYADTDTTVVASVVPVRLWNYGLASFDRTHVFKANWVYDIPSTRWSRGIPDRLLNHWQVSGIASFISGQPLPVGYTLVTPADTTGTPDLTARIVVTGNPVLGRGERTFNHNFNTSAFQAPLPGTIGNSAPTVIRGPGVNNFDLAVTKNLPLNEKMRFQLRLEMYNALNHTQFSTWDTTARFDANGNQINARLGSDIAARAPREIQIGARFLF